MYILLEIVVEKILKDPMSTHRLHVIALLRADCPPGGADPCLTCSSTALQIMDQAIQTKRSISYELTANVLRPTTLPASGDIVKSALITVNFTECNVGGNQT